MLPRHNQTLACSSSSGSWVLELCLGKEKAGASKVF
jgi:hypothetical protein